MNDEQQFIEVIRKSFDREYTAANTEIEYLVELAMTKEEYEKFIKIIYKKMPRYHKQVASFIPAEKMVEIEKNLAVN